MAGTASYAEKEHGVRRTETVAKAIAARELMAVRRCTPNGRIEGIRREEDEPKIDPRETNNDEKKRENSDYK